MKFSSFIVLWTILSMAVFMEGCTSRLNVSLSDKEKNLRQKAQAKLSHRHLRRLQVLAQRGPCP